MEDYQPTFLSQKPVSLWTKRQDLHIGHCPVTGAPTAAADHTLTAYIYIRCLAPKTGQELVLRSKSSLPANKRERDRAGVQHRLMADVAVWWWFASSGRESRPLHTRGRSWKGSQWGGRSMVVHPIHSLSRKGSFKELLLLSSIKCILLTRNLKQIYLPLRWTTSNTSLKYVIMIYYV